MRFGGGRVAFCSGPGQCGSGGGSARVLVFVGGLTDGLLATGYVEALGRGLAQLEPPWGLVQPLLSSAYSGFGTSSLAKDVEELAVLTRFLRDERGARTIALAGHSTGCQDAVTYVRDRGHHGGVPLAAAVLQAPVSDREYAATLSETPRDLAAAQALVEAGRGDECLPPRAVFGVPVSAERYVSLYAEGGADDMFSSDLSDAQLSALLGHMSGTPALLLFSGKDEYVPKSVDVGTLAPRIARAMGPFAQVAVVPEGDHAVSAHTEEVTNLICTFLAELPPEPGVSC